MNKPLCVDLDGTLIRTDSLIEAALALLSRRRGITQLPCLLAPTRASFKQRLMAVGDLAPDALPYNSELLAFIAEQRRSGRRIVLATAADESIARAVADHLGLFDDVVASDGVRNLKGGEKARELVRRYGHKGFDYAGDSHADIAVWREADGVVLVNASPGVARRARALGRVVTEINDREGVLSAAIRGMRPHQWVKNLLVLVPLLASRSFTDWPGLLGALWMFASFCLTASGIYLVNDLLDLEADRRHPRKRRRPLASGALPLPTGAALAVVLVVSGFALAREVGAAHLLLTYAGISLGYSLVLKTYPLLDVFILAALYTLRILAGAAASGHPMTLWLLGFSGLLFLSLALIKRSAEIISTLQPGAPQSISRRGYRATDLPMVEMFGIGATFASSVVLALFINSSAALQPYSSPELLWGLVPLILLWQLRLWLATHRGNMHDDPIVFAAKDWVSWLVAASVFAVMLLASSETRLW